MNDKIYAVRIGRSCGIFTTWEECKKQVDGFPAASYKSFRDIREALHWLNGGSRTMSSPSGGKTPRRPIRRKQSAPPEAPAPHPDFVMYTDGSCLRNPDGPGGWAAVITDQHTGEVTELHGGHPSTTNNRMELSAAIAALSFPSHPANIALYTDSQYLKNSFTRHWITSWKKRGWKKADGTPVLNQDLWLQLDALYGKHQVTFHWVRGHVGIDLNERCDQLAKSEAMRFMRKS